MSTLVLDTGALVALDRDDPAVWRLIATAAKSGDAVVVPAGAIAQAWRDGSRQARLARALRLCDELPLDSPLARVAGSLCGAARTTDVIDASVAIAAHAAERPSTIVTSDPSDLAHLLDHLGSDVRVLAV